MQIIIDEIFHDLADLDLVEIHAYSHKQLVVMHVESQIIKSKIAEIKKHVNNGL